MGFIIIFRPTVPVFRLVYQRAAIPLQDMGVEYVIESTGLFVEAEKVQMASESTESLYIYVCIIGSVEVEQLLIDIELQ
jgi:glyceraldehyde-3-phosphate dehydrogenase/erythrose-4-phosphate dehydrogenase